MTAHSTDPNDSREPARPHPIRDGVISAAIYAAEAISTVQGTPAHLIPTPTLPSGQPLITDEERELAEITRKQDEDRMFDLGRVAPPPQWVERTDPDREERSER